MDGSNDLILKFSDSGISSEKLFPLRYVLMDPVKAQFRIPTEYLPTFREFQLFFQGFYHQNVNRAT